MCIKAKMWFNKYLKKQNKNKNKKQTKKKRYWLTNEF